MDIDAKWHCALVRCTPSHSVGLFFGYAFFWCWVSLCVSFANSFIKCYFIRMVATIIWTFMPIQLILTYTFRLSETGYFWFCNYTPSWMFLPWTFSLNIGLNILLSDSFMLCLDHVLCYSTGEFHTLRLCPGDVWCRGLTTCPLHVGQLVGL